MFAYRRPSTDQTIMEGEEMPPPLVSESGKVYEHGTMGARFTMHCLCAHCKAYAAWYARDRRARARGASDSQDHQDRARRNVAQIARCQAAGRDAGRRFVARFSCACS